MVRKLGKIWVEGELGVMEEEFGFLGFLVLKKVGSFWRMC